MRVTAPCAIASGASCENPYSRPKGLKYGWSFCNAGFLLPHVTAVFAGKAKPGMQRTGWPSSTS
jgi:hypothetical protein